jgi:head-tail adaptor
MAGLSKIVDIGALDQLISIREATEVTDATGGVSETWSDLATSVWSKVEYTLQSSEGMRGEDQQVVAYQIAKFTFRDYWAVTEKMRIGYGGAEYDILAISPLGRDRFTVVEAEKRDNET